MFDSKSKRNFLSFFFLLGPFLTLWGLFWMVPTGLGLDLSLRCSNLELNHNTTTSLDSPEKGESFVVTGGVPVGVSGTTNYLTVLMGS